MYTIRTAETGRCVDVPARATDSVAHLKARYILRYG
jgi:hypothetical protein